MRKAMKRVFLKKGFTLIEILIVITILIILTAVFIPGLNYFQKGLILNNEVEKIVHSLRLAQSKALASEDASSYGVFFDNNSLPHKWVLFKGASYAFREAAFDEVHEIAKAVIISNLNLGGHAEIVFNRVSGTTEQKGSVSFCLINDSSKTRTIYIENSGRVGLVASLSGSDDNRFKDSRHVHFDYFRPIETATEKLILNFNDLVTEEVSIADNLMGGQFYWQGEIDVGGEKQGLKIHTHEFNSPQTQFCVHRDRRENNQLLTISLSGDLSGNLIEYSADGLTTDFTSIYVDNLEWQ